MASIYISSSKLSEGAMTNFTVVTSIHAPSAAVRSLARMEEFTLIVVGDKKSPASWECKDAVFLSAQRQHRLGYRMSSLLPWNHYGRKMLGYLYAQENGATVIYDTDDDNAPKPDWTVYPFTGPYDVTQPDAGMLNIYSGFTDTHVWPRGFDLRLINDPRAQVHDEHLTRRVVKVGVWQGMVDGDPDVDAIYRLTSNKPCVFRERAPIVLDKGTTSPFNSQNTLITQDLFPLFYLPCSVTFRFTDILRGLVAQPIMWLYGYRLGFTRAMVVQDRNPHDLLQDFQSEIPVYLHAGTVLDIVSGAVSAEHTIAENVCRAYDALRRQEVVHDSEMAILSAWLEDSAMLHRASPKPVESHWMQAVAGQYPVGVEVVG